MLHLDEGVLMALLDGELTGLQQREAEAHLRGCQECSTRLSELSNLMGEADHLIVALDEPTNASPIAAMPVARRPAYHRLAWAASIVAFVGLGIAGLQVLRSPTDFNRAERKEAPTGPTVDLDSGTDQPQAKPSELARENPPAPTVNEARESDRVSPPAVSAASAEQALSIRGGRNDSASSYNEGAPTSQEAPARGLDASANNDVATEPRSAMPLRSALADSGGKAAGAAPVPLFPRDELATRQRLQADSPSPDSGFRIITESEAKRLLLGAVRQVDGLTPLRFETGPGTGGMTGNVVRVVYSIRSPLQPTVNAAPVLLDQQRSDNGTATGALSSQLGREKLVTPQRGALNALMWQDLNGFTLLLRSPLPPDSLAALKARIR